MSARALIRWLRLSSYFSMLPASYMNKLPTIFWLAWGAKDSGLKSHPPKPNDNAYRCGRMDIESSDGRTNRSINVTCFSNLHMLRPNLKTPLKSAFFHFIWCIDHEFMESGCGCRLRHVCYELHKQRPLNLRSLHCRFLLKKFRLVVVLMFNIQYSIR